MTVMVGGKGVQPVREAIRKSTVNKDMVVIQNYVFAFSIDKSFWRFI